MPTPMPTGAKGMAAVTFAVVGWLTANLYVENMEVETAVGALRELTAVLGGFVGWKVMGNSVGKGYIGAIGSGLKTMIVLVFFALLFACIYQMFRNAVRMVYDGPFDAVVDIFFMMAERSVPLASVGVLTVVVVGGAIAGIMTENANRRWR